MIGLGLWSLAAMNSFYNFPIIDREVLNCLVPKTSSCAHRFWKTGSSYPLILLNNRFLRAAQRAFESRPALISPIFQPTNMLLINNSLFKSLQHSPRQFWNPARADFAKLSANSKVFGAKHLRLYKFNNSIIINDIAQK